MLKKETLQFLNDLKGNNSKQWFDKNRKRYEVAKKDFLQLVDIIGHELENIDKDFGYFPENIKIFRINRDVRFSKDKSPYKTNFGAYLSKGGMKSGRPGYYIHIEAGGKSGVAGGIHEPIPENLQKIRELISKKYSELQKVFGDKEFKKYFPDEFEGWNKLKTVPRGFEKNDPAGEILKNKSFDIWYQLKDTEVLSSDFIDKTNSIFKQVYKLNLFLNQVFK